MRHHDITYWWDKWFESRDPIARDRIIVHYSPLVKFVAGRVGAGLPSSVDPGDLVSAGVFGLIDAVERFDPGRGVKFETFAVPRIRGAVFDGLRSLDWVPRSVRSRAREVERAFTELESRHGRAPTDEEIAAHLKISNEEFQKWLVAIASTTPSRARCPGRRRTRPRPSWRTTTCAVSSARRCASCPSGRSS
jgi:RNA polymerase sigma factor FliA